MGLKRFSKGILILCLLFAASQGVCGQAQHLLDMEFKGAPLVDVFQILGEIGGYNVLVDPSVKGHVSFYLKELTLDEALDLVARTTGFRYKVTGNTLIVATEERLRTEFTTEDVVFIKVHNVGVDNAKQLVSLVLPSIKSYGDAQRQLLILYGGAADLEVAKKIIEQYDQDFLASGTSEAMEAIASSPIQLRSIPVIYGQGEAISEYLRQEFPHREFIWDAENSILLGKTTLAEWQKIEELVSRRDVPGIAIRGILTSQDRVLVLAEYSGSIRSLEIGDNIEGWTLVSVQGRDVEFARGEQRFTVSMGR